MAENRKRGIVFSTVVLTASVCLALGLTVNIQIVGEHVPLVFFFGAVAISTWFGGRIMGASAIVLGALSIFVFVFPKFYSDQTFAEEAFLLFVFVSVATATVFLASAFRGSSDSLSEEKELHLGLFENDPIAHLQIEPESLKILAVNQATVDLLGYSREEFLAMSFRDLRPPEEFADFARNHAAAGAEGRGHFFVRHVHKNGELIDVEVYTHDIEYAGKKIREGMLIDIRDKIRAEKAARETEARLRLIVDNLDEGLVVANSRGEIIHANPVALSLVGLAKDEGFRPRGKETLPVEHFDENGERIGLGDWPLQRLLRGEPISGVLTQMRPTGRGMEDERTILNSGILIPDENGETVFAVMRMSDVTERVRTEQALASSREQLDSIVSSAMDAIISADSDGKIVVFNDAAEEMFLYKREQAIGKDLSDLIPARHREAHDNHIREFAKSDVRAKSAASRNVPLFGLRSNGEEFPAEISISTVKIGEKSYHTSIVRDVTFRVKAFVAMREAAQLHHDLTENSLDIIYSHDLDGNITDINTFGLQLTGYTRDEAATVNIARVITPESLEKAEALIEGVLKGKVPEDRRIVLVAKDGRKIPLDVNIWLTSENGVPTGIRGIARDMTSRQQALLESRQSEERYRTLVENAQDIIFTTGLDRKVRSINGFVTTALGYSTEEIRERGLEFMMTPDSIIVSRKMTSAKLAGEKITSFELELIAKDGSPRFVDVKSWLVLENGEPAGIQGIARDITNQRNSNEALRRSEERYRTLVENAQDVIFTLDLNSRFTSVNSFASVLSGYSHGDLMAGGLAIALTQESLERSQAMTRAKLLGQNLTSYEVEMISKDGMRAILEIKSWLIYEDGKPTGIQGIGRDITLQKAGQESLAHSEERYRTLVENARDFIYSHDREGKFTSINRYASEITGYSVDEALTKNIADITAPESLELAREMAAMHLRGEKVPPHQVDIITRTGERITVSLNSWIDYVDSVPIGVEGIGRDITTEKKAMEALERSEGKYRTLVENAHDMIYSHDFDGNFTAINEYTADIVGIPAEKILKMNIYDVIEPSFHDVLRDTCVKHRRGEYVPIHRVDLVTPDGRTIHLSINSWPAYIDGVAGGVEAIARDVTDIMKLEERLMAAQKLESIGTLAGGIAHDFNNMMTIVTGYSELALRAVEPGNPIRQKLELIKETGDKAAELTHQLLAFSRKQMLQPKPVDLNATVGRVKKLLRRLIPEHIVLTTDLEPGLRTITADPDQIEQVILNLAINARDEMPTGGNLTIATKNVELDEISDEPNDQVGLKKFVRISISDAGQGMNEEAVRRIFDPYFSVQGIGRGGGLGLATVHGIVKQSGGEITVRSESGRGTTFDIVFPAMFGEEPSRASDGQPPLAKRGCGEVILVVEDDDLVRPVVMEMLNSLGYHPLLASGGAEAIAICMDQSKHVDLLLTDVIMPEMSGKQLMDELKRLRPEIKGVFMSGYTDEIVYVDGAVEPGSAFLGKPFAVSSLNEKIREVLDGDG